VNVLKALMEEMKRQEKLFGRRSNEKMIPGEKEINFTMSPSFFVCHYGIEFNEVNGGLMKKFSVLFKYC
jgi:hypothetical protein